MGCRSLREAEQSAFIHLMYLSKTMELFKNWESDRRLTKLATLQARQAIAQQFTATMFSTDRTDLAQQFTLAAFANAPCVHFARHFHSLFTG
ncbi:MAG: hypothetical protein Kow00121_14030 [Elainellaceae cyanobacterium]